MTRDGLGGSMRSQRAIAVIALVAAVSVAGIVGLRFHRHRVTQAREAAAMRQAELAQQEAAETLRRAQLQFEQKERELKATLESMPPAQREAFERARDRGGFPQRSPALDFPTLPDGASGRGLGWSQTGPGRIRR